MRLVRLVRRDNTACRWPPDVQTAAAPCPALPPAAAGGSSPLQPAPASSSYWQCRYKGLRPGTSSRRSARKPRVATAQRCCSNRAAVGEFRLNQTPHWLRQGFRARLAWPGESSSAAPCSAQCGNIAVRAGCSPSLLTDARRAAAARQSRITTASPPTFSSLLQYLLHGGVPRTGCSNPAAPG